MNKTSNPAQDLCTVECKNQEILRRIETAVCGDPHLGIKSLHGRMDELHTTVNGVTQEQDTQRDRITRVEGEQSRLIAIAVTVSSGVGTIFGAALGWLFDLFHAK